MKRGSNGGNSPGALQTVPAELEMAALDDLGPICRQVLVNGPLNILAYSIVSQVIDINDKIEQENARRVARGNEPLMSYFDPKEPVNDQRLAQGLMQNYAQLLMTDRSEDHARMGLVPLRAKPTVATLRERRKTEGRVFRW